MRSRLLSGLFLVLALPFLPTAASGQPVSNDIGLRQLLQLWQPATDSDQPAVPLDQRTAVSDMLAAIWAGVRPTILTELQDRLGRGDLLADGVTLQNLQISLPDPVIRVVRLPPIPDARLRMGVSVVLAGAGIEATATTPGPLPSLFDPRCSFRADLRFDMELLVGSDVRNLLRARRPMTEAAVPAERPSVAVTGFDWDSQGVTCDIIKAVVGLFVGESIVRQAAEEMGSSQASAVMDNWITGFDATLPGLNNQLAMQVPAGAFTVQAWLEAWPGTQGQRLAVGLSLVPPPVGIGARATINGTLQLGRLGAMGASVVAGTCLPLPLEFSAKTGPRPMLNGNGDLGPPPLIVLAASGACTGPGPAIGGPPVGYRIQGLSANLPNYTRPLGFEGRCRQGDARRDGFAAQLVGRPTGRILPGELGQPFDLRVTLMQAPCFVQFEATQTITPPQPIEEPDFRRQLQILTTLMEAQQQALSAQLGNRGTLQSLNPQPLPPEPPPELGRLLRQSVQLGRQQLEVQEEILRRVR